MPMLIDRSRLGTLVAFACAVLFSCSDTSDRPEQTAAVELPLIYLDPPTTVETGTPSTRGRTCPRHRLPDQCGGWAGVELVATVHDRNGHDHGSGHGHGHDKGHGHDDDDHGNGHGNAQGHGHDDDHGLHGKRCGHDGDDHSTSSLVSSGDDEHCLCEDIEFQIPSELPVSSGNSGRQKATLSFRTDAGFVECRYRGNLADKYLFERCSDGSVAGQTAHADWFKLEIHASNRGHEPTEVRLRLGEPDVVGGVVQEQIFYSDDPRIPGAALHVPRGAAPAFETFSLTVLPDVPIGTNIPNAGDGGTSVGFAVDVHADSSDDFTFTDVPGAACPRLELPYDSQALTNLVGAGGERFLSARQLTTLTGVASGAEVLAPVGDATVDLARGTISFCVQHLSFYLPFTAANNASLVSATILQVGTAPPPTDLLTTLPALTPGANYSLSLSFQNLGTTIWDSTTGNVRLIAVNPPTGTYPSLAVTPLVASPWGAPLVNSSFTPASVLQNQTANFTFNVTAPAVRAPLNFCLRQGASNFFGVCFSWDLGAPAGAGSNLPQLVEICDGFDNDGDTLTDENLGAACGSCGGQLRCDGTCSVPTPASLGEPCGCSGSIQCSGGCSDSGPNSDGICNCGGLSMCGSCSGTPLNSYYFDGDGDGQGRLDFLVLACTQPSHYVTNGTDCCDSDSRVFLGQNQSFTSATACGGFDFNCDNMITGEITGVTLTAPQASDFVGASQGGNPFSCEHDGWVDAIPPCGGVGTAQECCFCSSPIMTNIVNHPGAIRACR